MCEAFRPLLDRSSQPKVINITSGLGSIANTLNTKMASLPLYGVSKVALNGLTAHLQAGENTNKDKAEGSKIRFYTVAPGVLNTTLVFLHNKGKDPAVGAEVVIQLLMSDEYPGGTQWEFKDDKMQEIPW
jgi:NAD(P)-dependent dehydrogenase (short-subunit alcohol dehydrogenase family)